MSMLPHRLYSLTGEADVFEESDGVFNTAIDHDGFDLPDTGQGGVGATAGCFLFAFPYNAVLINKFIELT